MKGLVSFVLLSVLAGSCGEKENVEEPIIIETPSVAESHASPILPVLPVMCPTRDEMASDTTFGRYRSPSCSARRSSFLIELREPSLNVGLPNNVTVFRLSIHGNRGFEQLVRLQKTDSNNELIEKRTPAGPKKRDTIAYETSVKTVPPQVWAQWMERFTAFDFFDQEEDDPKGASRHGVRWELETAHEGRYHKVARNDVSTVDPLIPLCEEMMRILSTTRTQHWSVVDIRPDDQP